MKARPAFLSAFAAVYACAFISYWLQYDGLYSAEGLLPVKSHFTAMAKRIGPRSMREKMDAHPTLLWFLGGDDDIDITMEGLSLLGLLCAMLAVAGLHHGSLFLVMFCAYLSLFTGGQTFLSFQWDLFLLESGAATILYAPWLSLTACDDRGAAHPMTWPLRVLWVKFMLMSGAVKVFAQCPTWRELTALEFHFASTCLPTAEAWLAHSLPPSILRLGVAVMFICELLAPWLLLAPITCVRRVGCMVQLPLQLLIQLTGNYNWFNLHTAVLLLPAWASDIGHLGSIAHMPWPWGRRPPPSPSSFLARIARRVRAPLVAWETLWLSSVGWWLACIGALVAVGYASALTFPVTLRLDQLVLPDGTTLQDLGPINAVGAFANGLLRSPTAITVENHATEPFVRRMLDAAMQPNVLGAYLYTLTGLSALVYMLEPLCEDDEALAAKDGEPEGRAPDGGDDAEAQPTRNRQGPLAQVAHRIIPLMRVAWRALVGLAALISLGHTLLPFESITNNDIPAIIPAACGLRATTVRLHQGLRSYHTSNSYGLFRRMTGVAPRQTRGVPSTLGWGGLPPSSVQVPVVVLEGNAKDQDDASAGGGWREIPFRYTPFGEHRAPRRTAPHQPRLDWQSALTGPSTHRPNGHRPNGHRPNGHRPNGHRPNGHS